FSPLRWAIRGVGGRGVVGNLREGTGGPEEGFGCSARGFEGADFGFVDEFLVDEPVEGELDDVLQGADGGAGALGGGDLTAHCCCAAEGDQIHGDLVGRHEPAELEDGDVVVVGDLADAAAAVEDVVDDLGGEAARLGGDR